MIYILSKEHRLDGLKHNLHIHPKGKVLCIKIVVAHLLCPIDAISEIRLVVARKSWFYLQNVWILLLVHMQEVGRVGAWTYEAHRSAEHIQKLRYLVDACTAHEPANLRHSRVVVAIIRIAVSQADVGCIHYHRAKLIHSEHLAPLPYPLGLVEYRAPVGEIDDGAQHTDKHQHHGQRHKTDDNIHQPLYKVFIH